MLELVYYLNLYLASEWKLMEKKIREKYVPIWKRKKKEYHRSDCICKPSWHNFTHFAKNVTLVWVTIHPTIGVYLLYSMTLHVRGSTGSDKSDLVELMFLLYAISSKEVNHKPKWARSNQTYLSPTIRIIIIKT